MSLGPFCLKKGKKGRNVFVRKKGWVGLGDPNSALVAYIDLVFLPCFQALEEGGRNAELVSSVANGNGAAELLNKGRCATPMAQRSSCRKSKAGSF